MKVLFHKRNIFLLMFFLSINPLFAQVVINEVMSSNSVSVVDEDNEYPDWIEIYNNTGDYVNLFGFGLSDSVNNPLKWTFPDFELAPNDFLIVFASGKDRKEYAKHWETVIDWGDDWKYFIGTEEPPATWRDVDFDDASWLSGPSGFGYGDNDDATIIPAVMSIFVRKTFTIANTDKLSHVFFHIDFDDAFVAYLNGTPIAFENIDYQGSPPPFDQSAITYTEPLICNGSPPKFYVLTDWQSYLQNGENVLSIQLHNHGLVSSDLSLIPFLTLGMDSVPDSSRAVPDILKRYIPHLHTNFKISSEGEHIYLSNASGQIINSSDSVFIPTDVSYGRQSDGTDNWFMFTEPTPESSNNKTPYLGFASTPVFSVGGGVYNYSKTIAISGVLSNETVYYTTDGSIPDETSFEYTEPVYVSQNTVVRARTYRPGTLPSKLITNSYFFNSDKTLPIVSVVTDPDYLFDWNTGIYVMGPNASSDFPYFGANFWQDWEKPGNIEIFNEAGFTELNANTGIKIFGAYSRGSAQKSLSFFARKQYGDKNFNIKLFNHKPFDEFESFILRNSGNDWNSSMFRDAMHTTLVKNLNVDFQAYRPAIVYLNNQYWGIHNFREKVNEHFVASNHPGVDPANIDLLERNSQPIHGDASHYNMMLTYISADGFDYEVLRTYMDIENYIDYQLSQIYFNNTDWPGNNIKYWRPRTPEGKWRWILYDTDFGFGIWNVNDYYNNTLAFALEPNGPGWPNPPWSTYLFRRLVTNIQFRNDFINRFADVMNTNFLPNKVVTHIDTLQSKIETEMYDHIGRWGGNFSNWLTIVNNMRTFARNRLYNVRSHIESQFNLPGQAGLNVDVFPPYSGYIKVNTIQPDHYPWYGIYFMNVPVSLKAIPGPGYKFTGWSRDYVGSEDSISYNLTGNGNFTANFIKDDSNLNSIVINEINYNSSDDYNPGDWIELYNITGSNKDISLWFIKDSDEDRSFVIPENTVIEENNFIVLCQDTILFKSLFPEVDCYIGNFDFGLDADGELIRIFDETELMIDSVPYDNVYPWPDAADGDGPTLELINVHNDNSLGMNWQTESTHGTPGMQNSFITADITEIRSNDIRIYPNPFKDKLNIDFYLNKGGETQVEIYTVTGKLVWKNSENYTVGGRYILNWDGCDQSGNKLTQGIYIYFLISEDFLRNGKIILTK